MCGSLKKNTENKFSTPHPIEGLSDILNSGNYEPSVSINASENIIYFASERSGGFGGLDLYRTIKKNGVWQAAENLGPTINTEYDEDSPYIDPNNSTLYFSSKGHSSMGGYDIFKTYLIDSTWTYPMNMGFPLNSNSDDIFFYHDREIQQRILLFRQNRWQRKNGYLQNIICIRKRTTC
jgi:hypothetical protein